MALKFKAWIFWTLTILLGMWIGGLFTGFLPQTGNQLIDIFIMALPGGIISYWLWHNYVKKKAD